MKPDQSRFKGEWKERRQETTNIENSFKRLQLKWLWVLKIGDIMSFKIGDIVACLYSDAMIQQRVKH